MIDYSSILAVAVIALGFLGVGVEIRRAGCSIKNAIDEHRCCTVDTKYRDETIKNLRQRNDELMNENSLLRELNAAQKKEAQNHE